MARNLDMTALRSFVTVADAGGVTRAAGLLHLTQSAVSMQIKRLEESLGIALLDRTSRTVSLTSAGEQLLGYARKVVEMNDEVFSRLTDQSYEGEIKLGVPHDIVYPAIPYVLRRYASLFPRMRVNLQSSYTVRLKDQLARGELDVILTTEDELDPGGETLAEVPLVWVGAPGGTAWKQRPLRLAFEHGCIFRKSVQQALDAAGVPWEMAIESDQSRTVEACVSADLAVHCSLDGLLEPHMEVIATDGALPELSTKQINLYRNEAERSSALDALVDELRGAYCSLRHGNHHLASRTPVTKQIEALGRA